MYAIVEIAGLQYKVEKDQKLYVHRLQASEGDLVSFDKVLLTDNGAVTIGAPVISGTAVQVKVLKHLRGDKIIVFKKKRRKGYQKSTGHRQYLTQIQVLNIGAENKTEKKQTDKAKSPKKSVEKKAVKDNLTKIEGIGPKVAELFAENGIVSFSDLAAKSTEELKEILKAKGGRYASMKPNSWPEQSKMAAEGRWEELKKWQDELNGGE